MNKKGGNTVLWAILCVAIIAIVGLVIGIVIVNLNKGNGEKTSEERQQETVNADADAQAIINGVANELAKVTTGDIEKGVKIYQNAIEKNDGEVKGMLYLRFAIWLYSMDLNHNYKEMALESAKNGDSIIKTAYSAGVVCTTATIYEDSETLEEYTPILNERSGYNETQDGGEAME